MGKGSKRRPENYRAIVENWDNIFSKSQPKQPCCGNCQCKNDNKSDETQEEQEKQIIP